MVEELPFEKLALLVSRFYSKTKFGEARGLNTPCLEWVTAKGQDGYGAFRIFKKCIWAHRFSYLINKGKIDSEINGNRICVRHICDNPGCVNPSHLCLGTDADNIRDRDSRGRTYRKYDHKLVSKLKSERKSGKTLRSISDTWGVPIGTIYGLVTDPKPKGFSRMVNKTKATTSGSKGGMKGGPARAKSLTSSSRKKIASKGGKAKAGC